MSTTYKHAPGFISGDRPKIVTSRFEFEDSYTIERYLATDGYKGLRAALSRPANEIHDDVKVRPCSVVVARGFLRAQSGVSLRNKCGRVI